MVNSFVEVVGTHNFGFHPTGLFRESYVSHIKRTVCELRRRGFVDAQDRRGNQLAEGLDIYGGL